MSEGITQLTLASVPAVAMLATSSLEVVFANAGFRRATGLAPGMGLGARLDANQRQVFLKAMTEAISAGESRVAGKSFRLDREPDQMWAIQTVPTVDGPAMPGMVFLIALNSPPASAPIETAAGLACTTNIIDLQTIELQSAAIAKQSSKIDSQADKIVVQGDTIDHQARLLDLLMAHVPWGGIVADAHFRIEHMSDYGGNLLGGSPRNFVGRNLRVNGTASHIFHENGDEAGFEELPLFRAITNGQVITGEEWWTPDETARRRRAILCNAAPIFDENNVMVGGITTFGDITPLKDMVVRLHSLLDQKDVLLSELHHRVKNNLQTISSIAIAEKTRHPEAAVAIDSIIGYVSTVGAIHETLGLSPDASLVPFGSYAGKICHELRNLYRASTIEIAVTGVEELPLDAATPLGLIINELVSNGLKHAFVGRASGVIRVSFTLSEGAYLLEVTDDGIGLPGSRYRPSLGMRLVDGLVNQLGGTMRSVSDPDKGTAWRIQFPQEPNARRAATV